MQAFDQLAPSEQLNWYYQQSLAGDCQADRELGRMYAYGFTHPADQNVKVLPDAERAKQYLQRAIDGGDGASAFLMGTIHDAEVHDAPFDDPREAFRRYQQAVDLGYEDARYYLAACYLVGKGVRRNDRKGRELMIEIAYEGHVAAQVTVASIHAHDRNTVSAFAWRIVAYHLDDEGLVEPPKVIPGESEEAARLILEKVYGYSAIVDSDAVELQRAADRLRKGFYQEIRAPRPRTS